MILHSEDHYSGWVPVTRLNRDPAWLNAYESFNLSVKFGRLRLRPWRRIKEAPPYSVYWILLNPKLRGSLLRKTEQPKFPFRRFKVRNRQELDDAIYHGMVSSYRQIVYRFNAKAFALNTAHSLISQAIDGVRKQLEYFSPYDPPVTFKNKLSVPCMNITAMFKALGLKF